MEWSWRTVLILIGLLAIAAIMVDGFRRMKRARAEALRLDIQPGMDELDDEDYNPELPGTVRVVSASAKASASEKTPADDGQFQTGYSSDKADAATQDAVLQAAERREPSFGRDDTDDVSVAVDLKIGSAISDSEDESPLQEASHKPSFEVSPEPSGVSTQPKVHSEPEAQATPPRADIIPTVKPVDLNEKVPVLLDVEELGDERSFEEGIVSPARVVSPEAQTEPVAKPDRAPTTDDVMSDAYQDSQTQEQTEASSPVGSSQDTNETYQTSEVEDPEHIEDPHLDQEVESMPEEPVISQPVNYAGANAEVLANRPDPELVLVIHTIAREEGGFNGSDLLFLFNSCDLRYGEKDIFHRFEEADGQGRIQFSVAQVRNPGTFDPSHMADQSFMGLSFFMSLPGAKRPLEAYEAMSEMAMVVSRNLNADVLDESHSAMTTQTMEHERQQILEYERQQRLAAKKRV
ncbi:cell division protein ZipA [Thalassolituus sp.]|uniref:cell division protein ZipA n=1 Tax=Thalassolituus sp. TaxID=2030822 RepID=UPI00243BD6AD|nr:cell division protein ZipA [Thalassolituus sp.]